MKISDKIWFALFLMMVVAVEVFLLLVKMGNPTAIHIQSVINEVAKACAFIPVIVMAVLLAVEEIRRRFGQSG